MDGLIGELKTRARILHRQAQAQDVSALERLRTLAALRQHDDETLAAEVKRRHCLAVLARQLGFQGWPHATAVLRGDRDDDKDGNADSAVDFGTLLYPPGADAHWNIWFASYDEARKVRAEHGGYLLTYRRQFFIADRHFIVTLGLDPEDPDWEHIGRDWARPAVLAARQRLYAKLIRHKLAAGKAAELACA